MRLKKHWIWGGVLLMIFVLGYFSFGNNRSQQKNTIRVGIMAGSQSEQEIWNTVAATAKKRYGLNVQFQTFTDYSQPNAALSSHNIDVNAFQNYPFLKLWNQKHHTNITAVGDTIIEPMRIYSYQAKRLNDLPTKATITIPNDTNNESRALFLLQSAGLITLKPHVKIATLQSIQSNLKQLKIKEVDASQTARSLSDVSAAVVNGNYAQTANLNPQRAIFSEPLQKNAHQWINFIAANQADRNNPKIQKLVKAYQSEPTARKIKQVSGTNQIPAWKLNLKE
ncbi:Methionine ABC transporter substrate-binding protein [Fructilactobacillus florum 8D]|uniref:Lipoprotein n=1 Tax=Fructilactobacillus florum 8D TaxID=1221538 RepID=W9EI63_9LACO|nr:MetQ/NlpA family ABC transporter substrate-binding protein [Fructilactobacillus florum]ETO40926.1 Methionine ABC transporter substrate-binding protein [Fructilactobacillus florum 8D]